VVPAQEELRGNMNIYNTVDNVTDNDWEVFSKWVKGVLITHTPIITFTKKDGTERVMKCTLRSDLLPVQEIVEGKEPRKQNDAIMSVYDVEANGWRSFTVKSVKTVEFPVDFD